MTRLKDPDVHIERGSQVINMAFSKDYNLLYFLCA